MPTVFIGVGSNLGDRASHLEFARKEILSIYNLTDLRCQSIYETEPVDVTGGPFLNAVWSFETVLSPRDLLEKLQAIESKANRQRNKSHEARTLDLDLLFYGDQVIREPGLTVPHPRLHERLFVLEPMAEIAPDFMHPVLGKTIKQLLKEVHNQYGVRRTQNL